MQVLHPAPLSLGKDTHLLLFFFGDGERSLQYFLYHAFTTKTNGMIFLYLTSSGVMEAPHFSTLLDKINVQLTDIKALHVRHTHFTW